MDKIAQLLRFLQLFSHIAHNQAYGEEFFEDHAFFGELYPAYEGEYDSVVERMIGLGMKPDLATVLTRAAEMVSRVKFTDNMQAIRDIQRAEKSLTAAIETEVKGKTQGTIQLLGDIANASEVRQYKMQQKLKV